MDGTETEHVDSSRLTFTLKDMIMMLIFIGGMLAYYFGSQATVGAQMEQVATKIALQKLETVTLRLDRIENSQSQVETKIDRLLDALINHDEGRRAKK